MSSSKLCYLPQETTIFTMCDFFKLQLCFILKIFLDPKIAIISLVMGTMFQEHQWPQEQSGTVTFHCFHKKTPTYSTTPGTDIIIQVG